LSKSAIIRESIYILLAPKIEAKKAVSIYSSETDIYNKKQRWTIRDTEWCCPYWYHFKFFFYVI